MENYEFVCQIGKGNFGRISKIIRKSDKKTLIWKELDYGQMSEKEKEQIVSEVNILRELKHPNIVRYYDRIIDKKHSRIYIIMEYCEGGDLNQLIKRCKKNGEYIQEDIIWRIFTQVLLAIHAIHTHKEGKILHRDIKPSNIFLDKDNNVKLGDFGLSRELSDQSKFAYSHVGTPYYMSPEQIDETKYDEKSDIWSLGCFLYELTTFHPPFEAKNQIMLAMRIKSGKVEKINKRYSEELWRVITWMLTVNANERPTSENLLNTPAVWVRLREKRIRDTLYKLKIFEEKLNLKDKEQKDKEELLNNREKNIEKKEQELKEKEDELKEKEEELKEKEIELKEKENELKEKEKKIKNVSSISNGTTTGYSNNMNNSNSNSHNNYMNSSNNMDACNLKNNIIKNMINNNSDLNALLMYSTKNNYSNSTNNNFNNLILPANTNTSINNISLLNNNQNNINNNINKNNNFLLSNNNEMNKNIVNTKLEDLSAEYTKNMNYDKSTNNNYSNNNIYSEFFTNSKFKNSFENNIKENLNTNLNDSDIKNEFTKIKNNLNMSNVSNSNNKRNNASGSFINSLKQKISNSFVHDENNFFNFHENKICKEKEKKLDNSNNSIAKKLNEYDINNYNTNENNENKSVNSNLNLNKTMKYNIKNNKLIDEEDFVNDINKKNSNIINIKKGNDLEKRSGIFNEYDNYTNLLSQINNINTKYNAPSKVALSTKNSMINNKSNYELKNNILSNTNIHNSVNNFNSSLLNKSSKNNISNKPNINTSSTLITNNTKIINTNFKTVSNMDRINDLNNYHKLEEPVPTPYDFEIANKIGYDTGRPNTHCGITETFSNDNNITSINNATRNNNFGRETRINTLRNNMKRAKTPIMNKIQGRNFDNTPNKYNNNELNNNKAKKIEYGINNYYTNINAKNRTMIDNTNINNGDVKKSNHNKIQENKNNEKEKNKTINNTCRNKSGNFSNYRKKKSG